MTVEVTETHEIEVPWWIAAPLTLLVWGGLIYVGILIGQATTH